MCMTGGARRRYVEGTAGLDLGKDGRMMIPGCTSSKIAECSLGKV